MLAGYLKKPLQHQTYTYYSPGFCFVFHGTSCLWPVVSFLLAFGDRSYYMILIIDFVILWHEHLYSQFIRKYSKDDYWHLAKNFTPCQSPDMVHRPVSHISAGLPKKENGCAGWLSVKMIIQCKQCEYKRKEIHIHTFFATQLCSSVPLVPRGY